MAPKRYPKKREICPESPVKRESDKRSEATTEFGDGKSKKQVPAWTDRLLTEQYFPSDLMGRKKGGDAPFKANPTDGRWSPVTVASNKLREKKT